MLEAEERKILLWKGCSFPHFLSYLLSANAMNPDTKGILGLLPLVSREKPEQCCKLILFKDIQVLFATKANREKSSCFRDLLTCRLVSLV